MKWRKMNSRHRGDFRHLTYIHTYIIDHYNPAVRIIHLVPHTTYVGCVNFIHKWRNLQFKVDSEWQIFDFWETFSWQFYLLSRVFARNLLRGNRRRNTFRILFWCLAWGSNSGFTFNNPTQYILDFKPKKYFLYFLSMSGLRLGPWLYVK